VTETPATSEATPTAWWEDYLEIFFAPSRVFARRENSGFLLPLIILTVLGAGLALGLKSAIQPALDADTARSMATVLEQNPELTAEQLQTAQGVQDKAVTIAFIAMFPLLALILGLMLWLMGKFVGATETLKQATLIATFASFPRLVGVLAAGIQGLVLSEDSLNGMNRLSVGPSRFLDADVASAMSVALANRFDLTLIWITILMAIGLKVIAKIPMNKAMIAAGLVWLVGALPALIGAARAG
jgi:hypothetical protein